jgi:hypothetical protein
LENDPQPARHLRKKCSMDTDASARGRGRQGRISGPNGIERRRTSQDRAVDQSEGAGAFRGFAKTAWSTLGTFIFRDYNRVAIN